MTAKDYKPTSKTTFTVSKVGEVRKLQRDDPFVECRADVGIIAFWGGETGSGQPRTGSESNGPRFESHASASSQTRRSMRYGSLKRRAFLNSLSCRHRADANERETGHATLAAEDLSPWQRAQLQIVAVIDGGAAPNPPTSGLRVGVPVTIELSLAVERQVVGLLKLVAKPAGHQLGHVDSDGSGSLVEEHVNEIRNAWAKHFPG
jgi:hypothetical protein